MVNVIQAMILTDGPKMVLTPTYHVFKMYLPFQDATLLPVTVDAGRYVSGAISLPRVDAIAARAKDGVIWIAAANLDPKSEAVIEPGGAGISGKSISGEVLTADAIDAVNSFEKPETVRPSPVQFGAKKGKLWFRLPAKSIAVLRLNP
jgi:alpha-L-arabinofuranosidase